MRLLLGRTFLVFALPAVSMAILACLPTGVAAATIFRCVVDGAVVYSDEPCAGGTVVDLPKTGSEKADAKGNLPVSDDTVQQCFDTYRVNSRDPTDAKILNFSARMSDAGYPYLNVEAVFRNQAGGPERTSCVCRLTTDLTLDKYATGKSPALQAFIQDNLVKRQ
jgi:hypothetical protein